MVIVFIYGHNLPSWENVVFPFPDCRLCKNPAQNSNFRLTTRVLFSKPNKSQTKGKLCFTPQILIFFSAFVLKI